MTSRATLRLVPSAELDRTLARELAAGHRCALLTFQALGHDAVVHYPASHNAVGYAHDLYGALRQLEGADRILMLALTGWGQADARRRTLEAGFDHHLVKPVELEQITRLAAPLMTAA